ERGETGEYRLAFRGDQTGVEFVSTISDGTNWGGLYRFVIGEDRRMRAPAILVSADLFRPQGGKTAAAFERPILAPIEGVEFSYFGPPAAGTPAMWTDHWLPENGLPWLIRMNVRLPPGSRQSWPELVIELKLAQH